jgi:hypothetical protein
VELFGAMDGYGLVTMAPECSKHRLLYQKIPSGRKDLGKKA